MDGYLQFAIGSIIAVAYLFAALSLAYAIANYGFAHYLGLNSYFTFVLNVIFFVLFMVPLWFIGRPRQP